MAHEWNELSPFPWYADKRENEPVYFNPSTSQWNVFLYDDVTRVLSDYESFSSDFSGGRHSYDNPISASLISTDPPRHRELRMLVSQAFTPRSVERLVPRISEIAERLLDEVFEQGHMDMVHDFAYPLPVIVIAEMLGIPVEDRADFKRWSDALVTNVHQMETAGASVEDMHPEQEMAYYFMKMIEERRRSPKDDLISRLLNASVEGQTLSPIELLGFCVLLLVAGNETTTNLISNAMICLAEHPETAALLRSHPEGIPSAIEEVLRYRSPVQSMFRYATKDVMLGECTIHQGQSVTAWIGSANHDSRVFKSPESFQIDRSPNRHIAFGHGIHFCLGAPLARLEAKISLSLILSRLQNFQLDLRNPLVPVGSSIVYGVKHLPIQFQIS